MKAPFLLIPLILLAVTACQPAPQTPAYPPLRYTDMSPIRLDVASITVQQDYQPPLKAPNVDHVFPVPPSQAMTNWANDRLKATGRDKTLLVIIKDASVREEKLNKTSGIKGTFTHDQESKFTAQAVIELRVYGDAAVSLANTEVQATRYATISENASLAERDQLYYDMTRSLMADINAELEKNIQRYFTSYIQYSY